MTRALDRLCNMHALRNRPHKSMTVGQSSHRKNSIGHAASMRRIRGSKAFVLLSQ